MLHQTIERIANADAQRLCVTRGAETRTYTEALARSGELASSWPAQMRGRVGVFMPNGPEMVAALAALDVLGSQAFLGSPFWSGEERTSAAEIYALDAWIDDDDASAVRILTETIAPSSSGAVTIFTSGTTGAPKAARHTWASLASPVRVSTRFEASNWLLAYPLHLYAGLQVFSQAIFNGASLHIPADAEVDSIVNALVDRRVQYASATPSYWRRILLTGDADKLATAPLEQITLGGEPIDQPILDRLANVFPSAKILHIYASSEMGRILAVDDGLAGFPASYLDANPESGVSLRIEDGQLLVRSEHRMSGYDDRCPVQTDVSGWFSTGDLVEVRKGRVYFVGRESEIINVGGNKVSPLEVEEVVRSVGGVADCRVFAVSSSIVGQMVGCEIVLDEGASDDDVRKAVAAACAGRLTPPQRPRKLQVVESIGLSIAGKVVRS